MAVAIGDAIGGAVQLNCVVRNAGVGVNREVFSTMLPEHRT